MLVELASTEAGYLGRTDKLGFTFWRGKACRCLDVTIIQAICGRRLTDVHLHSLDK